MKTTLCQAESLTDEELALKAYCGSKKESEILIKRYMPLARKRAYSYFLLGSEKEDLYQEALVGLYKAILKYDPAKGIPFRVFADICITRAIISAIKKACRLKHGPLNNYLEVSHTKAAPLTSNKAIDPLKFLLNKERAHEINRYFRNKLSPFEKKVLSMQNIRLSYKQMAILFNKSEKSIDNAVQRIRRKAQVLKNLY